MKVSSPAVFPTRRRWPGLVIAWMNAGVIGPLDRRRALAVALLGFGASTDQQILFLAAPAGAEFELMGIAQAQAEDAGDG